MNHGPFPAVGDHIASEAIAKNFFQTATKATYQGTRKRQAKQVLRDGAKFKAAVGRHAASAYRPSEAYKPSDGDPCYRRDFDAKPLDNAKLDRDLCRLWAMEGRDGGRVGMQVPLESLTTHRCTFPPPKGPIPRPVTSCKPEIEGVEPGIFWETLTSNKRSFKEFSTTEVAIGRAEAAKPHTNSSPLPAPCEAGPFRSSLKKAHSVQALYSLEPTHWRATRAKPQIPPGLSW